MDFFLLALWTEMTLPVTHKLHFERLNEVQAVTVAMSQVHLSQIHNGTHNEARLRDDIRVRRIARKHGVLFCVKGLGLTPPPPHLDINLIALYE